MMRVDHVVRAVRDLDVAAAELAGQGLATTAGGVHPRWGTANRIASLGGSRYIELLAVVDAETAMATALGAAVATRSRDRDRWFALSLADDELEATARRLALPVEPGGRTLPDGRTVAWHSAGIDAPSRTPDLPFFIRWDVPPGAHPGDQVADHASGATDIAWIEIAGDADRFASWVGDASVPVRFADGDDGVAAVALSTPSGEVVLR